MIATVERLVAGGEGLVRVSGEVFLVSGVVPGDQVELAPEPAKRGARRARLVRLVEASPDRIEPPCPFVDACGGCPLMRLGPAAQLRAKAALLGEALRTTQPIDIVAGPQLAYRTRARLRWTAGRVGYLGAGSRRVVDVERCVVLSEALAEGLAILREAVPRLGRAGEARLVAAAGGSVAAAFAPDGDPAPELFRTVESLVAGRRLRGAIVVTGGASRAEIGDASGEAMGGDGRPIAVDPDGFAQPCDALVPTIAYALVAELAPTAADRLLELYAGAGTWTVALAGRVGSLVAVESDARAARRLEENLAARGLVAVVRRETAEAALESPGKPPTLVVLDPPRTGAREAIAGIAALSPNRIAYVSCDPATLGRDLGLFQARGYRPISIRAFDLMPQTAEVEALVVLEPG